MREREGNNALDLQPKPGGIKLGQMPHANGMMHDMAVRPWIAEQICNFIGTLAEQGLRINREPATGTTIKNIVMMQIAVQRDNVTFRRDQITRNSGAAPENWNSALVVIQR